MVHQVLAEAQVQTDLPELAVHQVLAEVMDLQERAEAQVQVELLD
jgi:hypothetical protein